MSNRIWIIGTALVALAVVGLGFLLGIQPKLTEMQNNAAALATAESLNASTQAELEALRVQYENIDEVRAQLEELRKNLPVDGDYEGFLVEMDAAAQATGTTITTYSQGIPIIYGPAAVADATDPAAAPTSGGTLLGIPISFTLSSTDPAGLFAFLNQLRLGERLFLLGDFVFTTTEEGSYTVTLNAHIFTLVDPSAVPIEATTPPVVEETPVPTETPTETPVPTDSATPAP